MDAQTPKRLKIDLAEAARFLALLDPDGDKFLFSSFDDDKERDRRRRAKVEEGVKPATKRGEIDRLKFWMEERQALGASICTTVQAFRGTSRKSQDIQGLRAIFGEFDTEPRKTFPIQPSITIETSPGKFHAYWLIDAENPIEIEDFDGIKRRIVTDYGADANARDRANTALAWLLEYEAGPRAASRADHRWQWRSLLPR